jgi:hypothetical protein
MYFTVWHDRQALRDPAHNQPQLAKPLLRDPGQLAWCDGQLRRADTINQHLTMCTRAGHAIQREPGHDQSQRSRPAGHEQQTGTDAPASKAGICPGVAGIRRGAGWPSI